MRPMKTAALWICSILLIPSMLGSAAPGGDDYIDQGDAAILLLHRLGLGKGLPANPTKRQAVREFERHGIFPFGERPGQGVWDIDAPLTEGDFAKILVESLRWQHLIPKEARGADPQAYADLLEANGIIIRSFSETVGKVRSTDYPRGAGVVEEVVGTDPLRRRYVFGEPNERGFGLDLSGASGERATPNRLGEAAPPRVKAPPAPEAVAETTPAPTERAGSLTAPVRRAPAPAAATAAAQGGGAANTASTVVTPPQAREVINAITRTRPVVPRRPVTPN